MEKIGIKMTAKEKCISKWEKRLNKTIKSKEKWGKYVFLHHDSDIKILTEIIKDLKRLK